MLYYSIENASVEDLSLIYELFEQAIAFQKANHYIGWQDYDKGFIQSDVENKLLYKIRKGKDIIGIFCICLSDVLIWREKEQGDAIYLHRIVLNQQFKGTKIFQQVFDWTVNYAKAKGLAYIRMDTWATNSKIIAYYKSYGFRFVEEYITPGTDALPVQHRNLKVALLEYTV